MKEPKMIGAVARCKHGKLGVICSIEIEQKHGEKSVLYKGVALNGTAWQSNGPTILANTVNDYIQKYIIEKEPVVAEISI